MFSAPASGSNPNRWGVCFAAAVIIAAIVLGGVWIAQMTRMPLTSFSGPLQALSPEQELLRDRLAAEVKALTVDIGERSAARPGSLQATVDYLSAELQKEGYAVVDRPYMLDSLRVNNLEAILAGSDPQAAQVVVGAHYDSVAGTVGANDNATGVAATLELARLLRGSHPRRNVRFVFFVNEEPPYFQTPAMGSLVYANDIRREAVKVSAMLSLETIGYYSDAPGSQTYPPVLRWFYPDRGNFIAMVGNPESRDLVQQCIREFRQSTQFPSEGVAAPSNWTGVGWSDHWSFWQNRVPAIMITDTAVLRDPHYHTKADTVDKVNFDHAARVVDGVRHVIEALANAP